jgi:photosystem II stability/assembly factor-like uncharacterized protein
VRVRTVFLITMVFATSGVLSAQTPVPSPSWPMTGHDAQQTGQSPFVGPQALSNPQTTKVSEGINFGLAIDANGNIYVPSTGESPVKLYAFNPDGTIRNGWPFSFSGTGPTASIFGSPAIGPDGTIYVAFDNKLFALTPNGTPKWSSPFQTVRFIATSPVIAPDGTIYVVADVLYAINPDGTQKWFSSGPGGKSVPTLGRDGTIYVAGAGSLNCGGFGALNADGTTKWDLCFGGTSSEPTFFSTALVSQDGTVYVYEQSNTVIIHRVLGLNPQDGTVRYQADVPTLPSGSGLMASDAHLAHSSDGTIVYLSAIQRILGFSPDLTTTRMDYSTAPFGATTTPAPIVGADNTIYVSLQGSTTALNEIIALSTGGTLEAQFFPSATILTAGALSADGTLYFGVGCCVADSDSGKLFAFKSNRPPLPAPTIISVSPTSGTQGQTITNFMVNGNKFNANATLSFSGAGIIVNSYISRTTNQIIATISVGLSAPPGFRDVALTNQDSQQSVIHAAFQVLAAPPPLVISISPTFGVQGQTISQFTVNGENFQPNSSLSFSGSGVTVAWYAARTATQIVATITISTAALFGLRDITVTNPDLQLGMSDAAFEVRPQVASSNWQRLLGPWSATCDTSFGAIAISPKKPNVIYIGSSHPTQGCGIFRSVDGGRTWREINQGFPKVGIPLFRHYPAVSKIAISPSDPLTLYVGTLENSGIAVFGRVFKSRDGGSSWSDASGKISLVFRLAQIHSGVLDLAIDPNDPASVVVGLVGDGIYRTQNSGRSWDKTKSGTVAIGATDYFMVVRAVPSHGTSFYGSGFTSYSGPACFFPYGCVDLQGVLPIRPFKSENAGKAWSDIAIPDTLALLTDLAIDPQNQNVLYASTITYLTPIFLPIPDKGVFKSADGGKSWQPINDPIGTNMAQYPVFRLLIDEDSPKRLYAATGFSGVFETTNGGATWLKVDTMGLPSQTFIGNIAIGGRKIYAITTTGIYVKQE